MLDVSLCQEMDYVGALVIWGSKHRSDYMLDVWWAEELWIFEGAE